jgi:hypothetical protein
MGGGSSDYKLPRSSPSKSEEKIHVEVSDAEKFVSRPEGAKRNVFISFNTDDEWAVNLLRSQAKDERFDVDFRDYSIKEPFDNAWKTQAEEIIELTSVMIVMIGHETASREAVNWEIRKAHELGKKVIGIKIYRDENLPIPTEMKTHGDPVINWDIKKLKELLQ